METQIRHAQIVGLLFVLTLSLGCGSTGSSVSTTFGLTDSSRSDSQMGSPLRTPEGYTARCQRDWVDLSDVVLPIAEEFEAQNIMYGSRELSDCSGIFHRFLRAFDDECPGYSLPSAGSFRASRDIAGWYDRKGLMTMVWDPLSLAHLIKPGAVMFYVPGNQDYGPRDKDHVLSRVVHVGVVVSVQRDFQGNPTSYRLFHGRSSGKPASITDFHRREPSRSNHKPFGNWDQQWIAIAPLVDGDEL